jgi:methylmalonyl-CoA mutase N-terminal domain/subunit
VYAGIDNGYFQGEIAEAAHTLEKKVNSGRHIVVGVNRFTESDDDGPSILSIGPEVEERQLKRLGHVKSGRDQATVDATLAQVTASAREPATNLLPPILDAVRAYATIGEIVDALASVFGRWTEDPVL